MIAALLFALGGAPPEVADFAESYLTFPTDEFQLHFEDLNGDGRVDLVVSLTHEGKRRLRVHLQGADGGFRQESDWRMSLPPDAVSFALADVREEPGLEILLLTRGGLYSVSATRDSLRGNLTKERTMPLFPDLSEDGPAPRWELTADLDADGREELCVVSEEELVALAPAEVDGRKALVEVARLRCLPPPELDEDQQSPFQQRGWEGMTDQNVELPYFPGGFSSRTALPAEMWFVNTTELRIPAFLDWNGDEHTDAVFARPGGLEVLAGTAEAGFASEPTRFPFPETLEDVDDWRSWLVDVDSDGRSEVVAMREEDEEQVFLILAARADGSFEKEPRARVKLSGIDASFTVKDLDKDGLHDLVAVMADIPDGVADAASVRVDLTLLLYRGQPGGRLSRRPVLRFERSFRPEDMTRRGEGGVLDLSGDFDGDGLNDLMLFQPSGLLEITPLRVEGEGWRLAEEPLFRYQPPSIVEEADALELSDDGIADLALRHDEALTLFVSRAAAGGTR